MIKENLGMCSFFFFLNIYTHIYLFILLPWVFIAAHRPSLVVVNGGYSLVAVRELLIAVASLAAGHGF